MCSEKYEWTYSKNESNLNFRQFQSSLTCNKLTDAMVDGIR